MTDSLGSRRTVRRRLGEALGSPLVLAFSVVALVSLVGGVCTTVAYEALCRQGNARAENDLRKSANEVRLSIDMALGAADPLLDRLHALVKEYKPTEVPLALLARMRGLATARAGMARLSVSLPDGTHLAVRRDDAWFLYGEMIHRVGRDAIREEFAFDRLGAMQLVKSERTDYDPRTRSYYELALSRRSRAWTGPYLFLPSFETGITRVEPLFDDPFRPGVVTAVVTVDFDTAGIEALLSAPLTPSERRLVVDGSESVLAASGVLLPRPTDRARRDSVHWRELPDRVLLAARPYFEKLDGQMSRSFEAEGEVYRLSRARITNLDGDPISLATISSEAELFDEARREARLGLATTAVTALAGVLLAILLSDNIARLRRKRVQAELGEQRAREELAQLGSYELIALIRKGGMGEVYRARHRLLAREAALKLIRSPSEDAARLSLEQRRFLEEARALASLRSAHTVSLYDFGIATDGRHFLAMELLLGFDLQELIARFGPQPARRTANILAQICDSLAEAHEKDMVHRDLKPANVFLCRQAEWLDLVKVLDFGLTRPSGHAEGQTISGTPGFMSPEQAQGEAVTARSDLYGVGCIGFWLLSGEPPRGAARAERALTRTPDQEVATLPPHVVEAIPAELAQLITRCLAHDPKHRPISAELLARALRSIAREASDFSEAALHAFWSAAPVPARATLDTNSAVAVAVMTRKGAE